MECRSGEHVRFGRDVKPLLASRCYSCHGPDADEAGLRLHEQAPAWSELESGNHAIVPGQPTRSELLARVSTTDADVRMPPEGKALSADEIATLRGWIAGGAVYEKHWAFVPPKSPEPPQVAASDWAGNPIDAFVWAKLQAASLSPNPPADKRVLARRLYYDLIGLPPTLEQLQDFLDDESPDAYQRLVDRLLESPHYGERWARHWLDLVRYAETNSFERDAAKPYAWRYRDYVIQSLNEDKPYDQFLVEQLAGDELAEVTPESIAATGYYRLGVWDDEPADPLQAKYDELDNILTTTGQAFLGLTIGCARCHDHKIDPILQADYYGLLAFFADVSPYALPHRRDAKFHSLWDISPPEVQQRRQQIERQLEATRNKKREIEQIAIARMEADLQRRSETRERKNVVKNHLAEHLNDQQLREHQSLAAVVQQLKAELAELPAPELYLSLAKSEARPAAMHVMIRGNPHAKGEHVDPHYPVLFGDATPQIPPADEDARSAGRRIVLAKWIA
ncbi:MAG: DUF1549 domain-containing protein, partial [Bythopirellula sp.]